jgi:hypothetical protein
MYYLVQFIMIIAFTCFEHLFAHHQEVLYTRIPTAVHILPPDDEQIGS